MDVYHLRRGDRDWVCDSRIFQILEEKEHHGIQVCVNVGWSGN